MIAPQESLPSAAKTIAEMDTNELVGVIVSANLPFLQADVADRVTYSDPLTLRRLAFLSALAVSEIHPSLLRWDFNAFSA